MTTKCFSLIRGRAIRVTRLDGCGNPVLGPDSVVVSDGFITVGLTANNDEGTEISVQNAAGKTCIQDTPAPKFVNYSIQVEFCGVDPDLVSLMTGQPKVLDGDENAVGFRVNSGIDADDSGFAMEMWSNVPATACEPGQTAAFGYFLVPFLKGGTLGDFTIGNDAVNFTLAGANSKDGNHWGVGPYDVVDSAGNEIQRVTITGSPTGGTFTITYAAQTTTGIARNATAATVQAALEALSNIAPGDVLVTGGPGPDIPYTVEFMGTLGHADLAQMTATSSLTGGTTPAVAVTTVAGGSPSDASPLLLALESDDHLHLQLTSIAPPDTDDACGAIALGTLATGATAGIPGTLTPANSYAPLTLAELQVSGVVASPLTAWTTGQFITLRDGSKAHWTSTAWAANAA